MSNARYERLVDLGGLLGESPEQVTRRLGAPALDRVVGEDRWFVFEEDGWSLRVRLGPVPGGEAVLVRSWTLALPNPREDLEAACEGLGLELAPATANDRVREPLLFRRGLQDRTGAAMHSLTARGDAGGVRSITAFDEAPDWRGEGAGA